MLGSVNAEGSSQSLLNVGFGGLQGKSGVISLLCPVGGGYGMGRWAHRISLLEPPHPPLLL